MLDVPERSVRVKLKLIRSLASATASSLPSEYGLSRKVSILLVGLPIILSAFYFFFYVSDLYTSEAKYVIRDASKNQSSPINDLIQSTGISKSTDDAHLVNEFFVSRDAMEFLVAKVNLIELYSRSEGDATSKFPSLIRGNSKEALFKYYKSMVKVDYDKTTGISTVTVKAFRAEDAQIIAANLLAAGERLANRITERMRSGLVSYAQAEMVDARERLLQHQTNLSEWRGKEKSVDPTKFSVAMIEVIARLSLELATMRAEAADVIKSSPRSPALTSLQNRIDVLERQINLEKSALVGGTCHSRRK